MVYQFDCQHGLMRFWPVFYKAETQRKIIDQAISFTFASHNRLPPAQIAQRAADAIQFFIPTFKNADFAQEAERRLIFTPYPTCAVAPRFRVRGSMLVPYYQLRDLAAPMVAAKAALPQQLPIVHITVGPSANKALNLDSLRMLLQRSSYAGVIAEASQTSFRS